MKLVSLSIFIQLQLPFDPKDVATRRVAEWAPNCILTAVPGATPGRGPPVILVIHLGDETPLGVPWYIARYVLLTNLEFADTRAHSLAHD